jgi:hypothetical protein
VLHNSLTMTSRTPAHFATATLLHLLTHAVLGSVGENTNPLRVSIWQVPTTPQLLSQACMSRMQWNSCMVKRGGRVGMEESRPENAEPTNMRAQRSAVKTWGRMAALCWRVSMARGDKDLQDGVYLPLMFRCCEAIKDCAWC